MHRARRLMTGGVAAGLLLTACGSNTPSKAAFAASVKTICNTAGKRHEQASQGFDFQAFNPDTSDLAPLIPVIEKNVTIGRDAAAEIDALRGPAADVAKADRFAAVARKLHDIGDQEVAALKRGDRAAFKALGQQEDDLHSHGGDPLFRSCQ